MKILSFMALTLFTYVNIWAQDNFTLSDAIAYAEQHHSINKVNELNIADAQAQIKEFKAIGLPKITAGIDYQYFFIRPNQPVEDFISPSVYGVLFQEGVLQPRELGPPDVFTFSFVRRNNLSGYVNLQTLLFDSDYLLGLKAARVFKELTANSTAISKRDLKADVTKAFTAVLLAEENYRIVEKNISNLSKTLQQTQAIYDNGFAEQLDVDRLTLTLQNLEIEKDNVEKVISLAKNGLKFQMYYPIDQQITVTGDLNEELAKIKMNASDMTAMDFASRPEYGIFEKSIELDKVDESRHKRGWLPSLRASAGLQESLQRDKLFDGEEAGWLPGGNVGLGLSFPIYDGGERKAQLQRTKIRIEKREIEFEEFKRGMKIQVQNARLTLNTAINTMENRKRTLDLNQKVYDTTLIKYKEGVGSSVEVNLAESQFFQAEAAYINAIYDVILAQTELDIALGILK